MTDLGFADATAATLRGSGANLCPRVSSGGVWTVGSCPSRRRRRLLSDDDSTSADMSPDRDKEEEESGLMKALETQIQEMQAKDAAREAQIQEMHAKYEKLLQVLLTQKAEKSTII